MDQEIGQYIQQLETESNSLKSQNQQLQGLVSQSQFQTHKDSNLIQLQLESQDILSRIEHFLRGDVIKTDREGNQYYEKQKDSKLVLLNEYGINSIMSIISNYVDKNTMLSFYDEMRINEIMGDLGNELANFIFCNYERMGMDTEFKKSRYNLIVVNILHMVESCYRRALHGEEGKRLNESRIFTQHDNPRQMPMSMGNKSKFNLFNPKSW